MRALISVSDKTGIVSFARELIKLGFEIVSTGGTQKILADNQVPVIGVESVTEFPEMLDGRVKTLHPKIHGGILALRKNKSHMKTCEKYGIGLIDLVVVNLYPFLTEPSIENIDIGGPSMIRSAAKNFESVGVVVSPDRYDAVIGNLKKNKGQLDNELRRELAAEAFRHTAIYDAAIANYFGSKDELPPLKMPILTKISDLRYGENPHQKAAFYELGGQEGVPQLRQLHGKELSYNNIVDIEAAWQIVSAFDIPGVAIIKHTNPCGAAVADGIAQAYQRAYDADPVSAFGSIVGLNRPVDLECAQKIAATFVEAVVAPEFEKDALALLSQKPSIRLIRMSEFAANQMAYKYVAGGFLLQTPDDYSVSKKELKTVTRRKPTSKEINDLLFAFRLVKYIKSNAILVAADGQSLGVGAGQMSRVEAVEIALNKAGKNAKGAVLASDAFFPFKDSVELAAKAGIKAIIQPGGSKRDQESIECCDANGIAMVFTSVRHFRH